MKTTHRLGSLVAGLALVLAACTGGASPSPSPAPASTEPAPSEAAPSTEPTGLSGEVTFWHSYGSGGGEGAALDKVLATVQAANPDLTINVVEQPFNDIFNKWNTDVAAGGGPDLFIAPNDNLFSQADAEVLADLDTALQGQIDGYLPVALDGSKVNGKYFMVPESLKAVAFWYDKSAIATPPATTEELLAAVKDGSVKLGINQGIYHQFGWAGSFGGQLMDESGKCTADQAGFADAFGYLKSLKDAGATFNTDGNALKDGFQTGQINAIIDGPWQTADFRDALGDKLAVAPIPTGPGGDKAAPLTGVDGWYINPNSANLELAINFALLMTNSENLQVFVDDAGHVPVNPEVTISDPITQGFSDAAAAGYPRPQRKELNGFWGPFGDALNKVVDTGADPAAAVTDACKLMNEANGL